MKGVARRRGRREGRRVEASILTVAIEGIGWRRWMCGGWMMESLGAEVQCLGSDGIEQA